jgi:cation:H+ antiporter
MTTAVVALGGGVAIRAFTSDRFVVGAARVAVARRVAPIVVGAVIIGFGTSSPELLVSALAAADVESGIAVGNIVGSNLVNLGAILGLAAVIHPVAVDSRTVRREGPLALAAMALFAISLQSGIERPEGLVLLAAMVGALAVMLRKDATDPLAGETVRFVGGDLRFGREVDRLGIGLDGTLAGARIVLWGATDLAERTGLAEGFVGATLVAVGTSLPELVTAIQSARRGQSDLLLGNLLGSTMFNALVVGGTVGLIGTGADVDPALSGIGAVAGVVAGAVVWVLMRSGHRIGRVEGVLLIVAYGKLVPLLGFAQPDCILTEYADRVPGSPPVGAACPNPPPPLPCSALPATPVASWSGSSTVIRTSPSCTWAPTRRREASSATCTRIYGTGTGCSARSIRPKFPRSHSSSWRCHTAPRRSRR